MTVEGRFKQRYEAGDTPWDIGKPDLNLVQTVTALPIAPCQALDMGCGTGDNAIWLSQQQFRVLGIDVSETAIAKARQKALDANAPCIFMVGDILRSQIEGSPFGFVFDRGFLHLLDAEEQRSKCAATVNRHLDEGGLWLSLLGNADEARGGPGPPRRTARDIVYALEPSFEILSLVSSHFELRQMDSARSWVALFRKRPPEAHA